MEMSKIFELIVFTAASKEYADRIIALIDPHKCIRHRLYQEHLFQHKKQNVKNLELLGRDLSTVLIIDDIPANFSMQPDNGIAISPFKGDPSDPTLPMLQTLLKIIIENTAKEKDIRKVY